MTGWLPGTLAGLLLSCAGPQPNTDPAAEVAPLGPTLRDRFGDLPFLTPIDAPATVALTAGGSISAGASTCASCHTENHAEWAAATHSSAIRDIQFLAELAKPGQPRWLCLNCHVPTVPQRARVFTLDSHLLDGVTQVESTPNPAFDPGRVAEGIGCATCHVRQDADGEGIVVGPRDSGRAPHRVRADRKALTDICVNCHSPTQVDGSPIVISPTFVCWFETAKEIPVSAAGPAAVGGNPAGCVDCHMPLVDRPAATGAPAVELRRHVWTGGGVPKSYDGYETLLARGWESGLDVRVEGRQVTLTNSRAGHSLPTADPERFLRVEARLEVDGAVISRDVLRIGQSWDWGDAASGRAAHRLSDTRLLGGETRIWTPGLDGDGDLVVEVAHVRLTPENAAGMKATVLDAELTALWPEAQALLRAVDEHYPLATWIFRERRDLATGAVRMWTQAELLDESKAFGAVPWEAKRVRLKTE